MLGSGQVAGHRYGESPFGIGDRAWVVPLAAGEFQESGQLVGVRPTKPILEVAIWVGGHGGAVWLERPEGSAVVPAHDPAVVSAEELHAHVVSERVAPGRGQDGQGARLQGERGHAGVDVVVLLEDRVLQD